MTPTEELDSITRQIGDVVKTSSIELLRKIKLGQPVDTGNMLKDWKITPTKPNNMGFLISNNVSYNWFIWRGRRMVKGKWYGSNKGWGRVGGQYVVDQEEVEIQKRLDAIKGA